MTEEGSTVQTVTFISQLICCCWVFAFDPGVIYCSVLCVLSSFTMVPLWRRELTKFSPPRSDHGKARAFTDRLPALYVRIEYMYMQA